MTQADAKVAHDGCSVAHADGHDIPLAALELMDLPMEEPGFSADPLPFFAQVRRAHPWLAKCAAGYVVHQHAAMDDLLRRDDVMGTSFDVIIELMGAENTEWGRFTQMLMTGSPKSRHTRLRKILEPSFTPRKIGLQRELMQSVISQLLDAWGPRARFDFEEFASYFPITVMCGLLGASPDVIPSLRSSMEALGLGVSLDRGNLPMLQEALVVFDAFVEQLVDERRANEIHEGDRGLLDIMIDATDKGQMTERELFDQIILLFVAGYDTSKNVLTMAMNTLIDHPDIYEGCAGDARYCGKVIDEILRYHSVTTIFRTTLEDIRYRGVLIPKGTTLFFPLSVSGRDPTAFEDPDRFDPDRTKEGSIRHAAFGRGMHICLGQFLAREQLAVGIQEIARRIKNPRRTGPVRWRPFHGVWGLQGLPIEFDYRPAS